MDKTLIIEEAVGNIRVEIQNNKTKDINIAYVELLLQFIDMANHGKD